jgi:hypothetical protein
MGKCVIRHITLLKQATACHTSYLFVDEGHDGLAQHLNERAIELILSVPDAEGITREQAEQG